MKLRILLNILLSIVLLGLAASVAGLLLAHRRQPEQRARRKMVPKVLAPPIRPRLNQSMEIVDYGSARPHVQLAITPQVTGIVVEKAPNFLSGKYIRKDQVLLRIDQTDYDLAVRRAGRRIDLLKAQLARLDQEEKNLKELEIIEARRVKLAKEQLDKVVKLLKAGAGSENEVDLATETLLGRKGQLQNIVSQLALIGPQRKQLVAEVASAEVDLAQANVNLDRCTLRSPVTGRVLDCRVEVGQLVQAGGDCGQIYGTDIMEVPVSVPATELEWLDEEALRTCRYSTVSSGRNNRIKARLVLQPPDEKGAMAWTGFLNRVEAGLDAKTRTATLVISAKNPNPGDGPELKVNMFCKVSIIGKTIPRVYVLPREAVLPDGSVYVVVEGRLQKHPVKVARYAGEEAMILPDNGISDDDRVIIGTVAKPVIGMKVKPVDALLSESDDTRTGKSSATTPTKP